MKGGRRVSVSIKLARIMYHLQGHLHVCNLGAQLPVVTALVREIVAHVSSHIQWRRRRGTRACDGQCAIPQASQHCIDMGFCLLPQRSRLGMRQLCGGGAGGRKVRNGAGR